jgi:hypothetical protein
VEILKEGEDLEELSLVWLLLLNWILKTSVEKASKRPDLSQDTDKWRDVEVAVLYRLVSQNEGNFFTC